MNLIQRLFHSHSWSYHYDVTHDEFLRQKRLGLVKSITDFRYSKRVCTKCGVEAINTKVVKSEEKF